jgi:putative hemolysin
MLAMPLLLILVLMCSEAFFAGVETGVYRLSKFRLRLGVDQKRPLHKLLSNLTTDNRELILTCLIGNNIVCYLMSATVTFIFISYNVSQHRAEVYNSFVTTPIAFIMGELIPKNIFFYRADVLMPVVSPVLWFFHKLFRYIGAIPVLKAIAAAVTRLTGSTATPELAPAAQRHQFYEIIKETREEGFLSSVQTAIMTRLANMHAIHLDSVMVPAARVRMVDVNTSRAGLLEELKTSPFTRMPVFEESPSNIVGYVEVYKALCSDGDFADLRQFVKPITAFAAAEPVMTAINRMRRENHKIVLVARPGGEPGKPLGIATMKDLVEELTGELAEW